MAKLNGSTIGLAVMGGIILGLLMFIIFAFFKAFFFIALVFAVVAAIGYFAVKRARSQ